MFDKESKSFRGIRRERFDLFRNRRTKLAAIVLVICVAFAAAVIMLPTALGTRWISDPIIARLRADDFHLKIDSIRLRWLSPVRFQGIEMSHEDGEKLLSIAEIRTDRGLLSYLISGKRLGQVDIIDPVVDIELISDTTNLAKFIEALEGRQTVDPAEKRERPQINVDIHIHGLTASVQRDSDDQPLVVIPPFDLKLSYLAIKDSQNPTARIQVTATEILDRVQLTPELMRLGLGYAVPLLAESAWFDGEVSLQTTELEILLDDPQDSTGSAALTMHRVRSGPTNPQIVRLLDFVAKIRGRESAKELVFVDGSTVTVTVKSRKVYHEGLEFGLPQWDKRIQMKTSGSVGLADRSLDLKVGIPVPIEQLAMRESVQEMGVPLMSLPIRGTLDAPQIEWNELRTGTSGLLAQVQDRIEEEAPVTAAIIGGLQGLASGEADEAIGAAVAITRDLIDRRKKASQADKPPLNSDESAVDSEIMEEPARPVRDAFRNLLRRRGNSNSSDSQ